VRAADIAEVFSAAPEGRSQSRAHRRKKTTVAARTRGRNHKPLGAVAITAPCPEENPTVPLRGRVAETGKRGLAPADRGGVKDGQNSFGRPPVFSARISARFSTNGDRPHAARVAEGCHEGVAETVEGTG